MHANMKNANNVEYGKQETLDTTVTQNIQPISTRPTESLETTASQHDHDHDHVQISTNSTICEHTVTGTIQCEKQKTQHQQTKSIILEPNFQNPVQKSTGTQLQDDSVQNEEPVITIEIESIEYNILGVNPAPENKSEI